MRKRLVPIQQVTELISLMNEANRLADHFLQRSDLTPAEEALGRKVLTLTESSVNRLSSLSESDSEKWIPLAKEVIEKFMDIFLD